jgi:hypothetical protein
MNTTRMRELYSSSNRDRWHLGNDESGKVFELNQASPRADKSLKSNCGTSSREDTVRSNKPYCK